MTRGSPLKALKVMGALAIGFAGAGLAFGDTFPPAKPVAQKPGAAPLPERMRTLVSTQCASCHESGALALKADGFGAAFDLPSVSLEELAADPGFVTPGFPEASPLFQVLLSKHRISDLGTTAGLSADEILTVHDWIEGLPAKTACPGSGAGETVSAAEGALVLSLAHLADGCRGAGRIAEWRALAGDMVAALTRSAVAVQSIDANGLVLDAGVVPFDRLTGADLEALRAMMKVGTVPLDGLAAFIIERGLPVRADVRSRVAALARLSSKGARPKSGIEVSLTSPAAKAKVGDALSLSVSVSVPCHLTIVSIDTRGQALVLFPNDIEEINLIQPGAHRTLPGADAGYQVRFDKPGTETFVALCQTGKTTLDGVKVDYEKQRFPVLGDWRGFIAVMDEQQMRIEKEKQQGEGRRSRRRGREAKPAPAPPVDPKSNIEGWAAIRIGVE